mmetsp:Transcript_26192/g.62036  ORF Transcript_26192/g.62036 Transcript_26192/m.62036 type:complete len:205 (-) Transcript_26192:154-768(-)
MLASFAVVSGYMVQPLGSASCHARAAGAARLPSPCLQADDGPLAGAQAAFSIFQKSKAEGLDFKQSVADAIAGEYDREAITAEVQAAASASPLVLFTWESSPACKKALKLLAETGAVPTIVRLDAPWSEGNVRRAALGRLTSKSSVPSIWIGGQYVGGCDDGPSDDAPGLVPLAFRGTLFDKLQAAGALQAAGKVASPVPDTEA